MTRGGPILSWIAAALAGAVVGQTGIPLAWLIGAAVGTALVGLAVGSVPHPRPVQRTGLVIVGAATGAKLDAATMTEFAPLAPLALILPIVGTILAVLFARPFARLSKLDPTTGFFSLLPGGVIEISHLARRMGGEGGTVAILHAVRIGAIVVLTPLVLAILPPDATGETASMAPILSAADPSLATVGFLLVVGVAAGFAAASLSAPVPWLLGPLVAVGFVSVFTGMGGPFPSALTILAQILLGHSLGSRLRRNALKNLPRALAFCMPYFVALSLVAVGLALVAGQLLDIERDTILLAFAVGGAPEMVLLAEQVGANAPVVAVFHIVRSVLINASAAMVWNWFDGSNRL